MTSVAFAYKSGNPYQRGAVLSVVLGLHSFMANGQPAVIDGSFVTVVVCLCVCLKCRLDRAVQCV